MARRYGVRFQRRFGQHFLADRAALERLSAALDLDPSDRIVEVGPGLGALTRELAARTREVVGIEIDPACVRALKLTLRDLDHVRIIEGDVLRQEVGTLLPAPYRVAGNIPYNLTGALFTHLLEQATLPSRIDLVVQREVAQRVAAPPGKWSLATLGVRVFGRAEILLTLPREAFYPMPDVASALLRVTPDPKPALPREQLNSFFQFARPFFQARRKQLSHALSEGLGIDKAEAKERLRVIGIDPARRAETLTLSEWARLFEREGRSWRRNGN
ncbi:MAG TPA: 16S rRNA (adenine(1518)-N(6)/adenine(1519)-N(6))-dimethyltransferase RsmA [Candidatus Limnocylindrales bacterium]|nr:16S rRNA (adenine(1518)-N(6)/adenine(1519)-N(6))-dimethyltransferase RsmA [Candidatus Limnocylindrales bacterium]